MIEKLISIPGPLFLLYYALYSALVIYLIGKLAKNDSSKGYEIPEPTKLSPIDIALLSNGLKGVISSAVFNLWRLKAIKISKEGHYVILRQLHFNTSRLSEIEKSIYHFTRQPKKYTQLLSSTSLNSFKKLTTPNRKKLLDLKLIPDSQSISRRFQTFFLGIVLLLGFGGTKLFYGINRDKPSILLIILLIISVVVLIQYIKPFNFKQTPLGRRFIVSTKQRFEWLKSEDKETVLNNESLLYAIGIFGINSFIGTGLESIIAQTYLVTNRRTGYFGGTSPGGCGGGCSSGCGGGCSGGCGGGCGGCGS